jgi:predicted MPP superfamily phosphohydrolase
VKRVALAAAAGALAVYAAWIEPRMLLVRELDLPLPRWPPALDGIRAGVITDLHAGVPHARLGAIERAVAALNDAAPDVHLLLGDYVDASQFLRRDIAPEAVAGALAELRAPLGSHAVLGNHDWRAVGDRMWRALSRAGINVLENRAVRLPTRAGSFWVGGVGDLRFRIPDIQRTLQDVPAHEPVLLLAHDPDVFPHVPGRVALTLSGHTHGGQVAIPGLRRPMLPSAYGETYARGLIVEDGRRLLVSSGIGTSGLPVRLLAPPEVLVLTLRSASSSPRSSPR